MVIGSIRQRVFEATLEQVEDKIKSGIWRPGDRLPTLPKLANELKVGISTLREVLRILESRNVVTIEQGRGMFVRTDLVATQGIRTVLSPVSVKELCEARSLIEPDLTFMAAQRGLMEEIEEIRCAAERMSNLVTHHENFIHEDLNFHSMIAHAAHNSMLYQIFEVMDVQLRESRHYTNMLPGMIEKAVHYHLMIAEALCERNAQQAKSLMKSHMDDVSYELSMIDSIQTEKHQFA